LCRFLLENRWRGEGIFQIQVTALAPLPARNQLELFDDNGEPNDASNQVMDRINERYGDYTVTPARLLQRSSMPDVIAPAWKPEGHRKTV
jgi:DNA polymerase-4